MSRWKKEGGVALILVLGSLLVLSTIVVEFAYNTHVGYEMAGRQRDRLKAYYLARSGYQFSRLLLFVEKRLRTQYASVLQNLQGTGVTSDPLCKQIPFSTGLLKGVAAGGLGALTGETEEGQTPEEIPAPEDIPAPEADEESFSFDGDFSVTCDTEERKINLNVFRVGAPELIEETGERGARPAVNFYDDQKNLLYSLLIQKNFETFFEGPDEVRKLVNAIADWADPDDLVNELPGVAGGSEASLYNDLPYKVKNGKYASVAELLLIPGMDDRLYAQIAPGLTVFGDNKINLCQGSDELIRAFALKASQGGPEAVPIRPDEEDRLAAVVEAVRLACDTPSPQPAEVAAALAAAIGSTGGMSLAGQITTGNRFYSVVATGQVNEVTVDISGVIDTGDNNPKAWKTLYYRAQ